MGTLMGIPIGKLAFYRGRDFFNFFSLVIGSLLPGYSVLGKISIQ